MARWRLRAAYACTTLVCGAAGFPAAAPMATTARSARVLSLAAGRSPAEGAAAPAEEAAPGPHTVFFKGTVLVAEHGETLRSALLRTGKVTPHNGKAQLINCRGLGTCGTCAVALEGEVSPASWNAQERLRLNFPPHRPPNNERLRLACQVHIRQGPGASRCPASPLRVWKVQARAVPRKENTRSKNELQMGKSAARAMPLHPLQSACLLLSVLTGSPCALAGARGRGSACHEVRPLLGAGKH